MADGIVTRPDMPRPLARQVAIPIMLAVATLFAANHVAARVAFDHNTGLLLAIVVRSSVALCILLVLVRIQGHPMRGLPGKRRWQILLGLLIALQSLCLYSSVARIPVAVALLLMNSYPIMYALITWLLGGRRPSPLLLAIMAVIGVGMVLVLDIPTWLSDPRAMGPDWPAGVLFGFAAAFAFALALWVTENRLTALPGAVRTLRTMAIVLVTMLLAGAVGVLPAGLSLPSAPAGWMGLALLGACYGAAFSTLFVLVPRLNMARNAPVMNFEPVASLILGFLVLGQVLTGMQLVGGGVVLAGIVWLGLMRGG